jgi:hypothetical protein
MVWPTTPESFADLPLPEGMDFDLLSNFEQINPGIEEMVCQYVHDCRDALDAITAGDAEKEKQLGMTLVTLAYRSATAATPEALLRERYAWHGVEY